MVLSFSPGDLVRARGREWVTLPAPRQGVLALRPLSGNENDIVVLDPSLAAFMHHGLIVGAFRRMVGFFETPAQGDPPRRFSATEVL